MRSGVREQKNWRARLAHVSSRHFYQFRMRSLTRLDDRNASDLNELSSFGRRRYREGYFFSSPEITFSMVWYESWSGKRSKGRCVGWVEQFAFVWNGGILLREWKGRIHRIFLVDQSQFLLAFAVCAMFLNVCCWISISTSYGEHCKIASLGKTTKSIDTRIPLCVHPNSWLQRWMYRRIVFWLF